MVSLSVWWVQLDTGQVRHHLDWIITTLTDQRSFHQILLSTVEVLTTC